MAGELVFPIWAILVFYLLVIWSAIWKGIGLWKSGRNNQLGWFVVIFLVNSLGILPIIYLTWCQKGKKKR